MRVELLDLAGQPDNVETRPEDVVDQLALSHLGWDRGTRGILGSVTEPTDLHGHWRLVGWTGTSESGEAVRHGGAEPRGDLIYLPSGRMAVQIQHDGRRTFGSRDLEAGDDDGRAEAYRTYIAYAGTWSLPEEGTVVHHLDTALHPDQMGMDKERSFTLEGDELALETQRLTLADGSKASSILRWRRD